MELNLKDIAQTAGSTVSLIIACTIFLHQLITKYDSSFSRYQQLVDEYRTVENGDARRDSLRHQISLYHRRLHTNRRALCVVTSAELAFLFTIIVSGVSVALPQVTWLGIIGAAGLVIGLLMLGVAAVLEVRENHLSKHIIDSEVFDFDDLPDQSDLRDPKHHSSIHDAEPSRA